MFPEAFRCPLHWRRPACPQAMELEFYDHRSDPGETVTLAASPNATVAAKVEELLAQLRAGWRAARV